MRCNCWSGFSGNDTGSLVRMRRGAFIRRRLIRRRLAAAASVCCCCGGGKNEPTAPHAPTDYSRKHCKPTGNLTLAPVWVIAGLAAGRGQRQREMTAKAGGLLPHAALAAFRLPDASRRVRNEVWIASGAAAGMAGATMRRWRATCLS